MAYISFKRIKNHEYSQWDFQKLILYTITFFLSVYYVYCISIFYNFKTDDPAIFNIKYWVFCAYPFILSLYYISLTIVYIKIHLKKKPQSEIKQSIENSNYDSIEKLNLLLEFRRFLSSVTLFSFWWIINYVVFIISFGALSQN